MKRKRNSLAENVHGKVRSHGSQKMDKRAFLDDQETLNLWPLVSPQPLLISPGPCRFKSLSARRQKQKAVMVFKSVHTLAPVYLTDLFNERSSYYNLRNSSGKLTLPKPRTNCLTCSFSYSGAQLWNSSPEYVRNIVNRAI